MAVMLRELTVARVSKPNYAVFDGEGSRRVGGRWNHPGVAIVYTSEHPALAILELLVHLDQAPVDYVVTSATIPREVRIEILDQSLPSGWNDGVPIDYTKDFGTRWATELRSAALSVPSVILPDVRNYLLNPAHREFDRILIGTPTPLNLDLRLRRLFRPKLQP
jgi:RES domain-containing protein